MTSSALVHSDDDSEFGYDETAAAPITNAPSAGVAPTRIELLPESVAGQISSVIGGLATEAASEANAAFVTQANAILPQIAQQHQTNLGHLAAAIVSVYASGPRGTTFNTAFQDGLNAAGLSAHTYVAPITPDFAAFAQNAIDEV